jgi:hypothetical protein
MSMKNIELFMIFAYVNNGTDKERQIVGDHFLKFTVLIRFPKHDVVSLTIYTSAFVHMQYRMLKDQAQWVVRFSEHEM